MFQTKVAEKIKTHILCSVTFLFFLVSCRLWDNWEKIYRSGHRWQYGAYAFHTPYLRLQVLTQNI